MSMSRPLRIFYKDACYHVMNRGANHQSIFYNDCHRQMFLELLEEIVVDYGAVVMAYCLMGNHYHLLLQTPHANLSRIMRHLDGVYTQRFNKITARDGSLFRGRYKAILVGDGAYLLQVSRYIHLNPVAAQLVVEPEEYVWSSLRAYLKMVDRPGWLTNEVVLSYLGGDNSVSGYADFINYGNDCATEKFYSGTKVQSIFGGKEFKEKVTNKLDEEHLRESRGDLLLLKKRPEICLIFEVVADYYGIDTQDLRQHRRGENNLPRYMAITVCKRIYHYKLAEIAEFMGNMQAEAISIVAIKFTAKMKRDPSLCVDYQLVVEGVKSQNKK